MNGTQAKERAAAIEAALLATPGVAALFPVAGTLSILVEAGTQMIGGKEEPASRVVVRTAGDTVEVEAAIGVDADHAAAETVRRAHAAIRAAVPDATVARAIVTLVHVDDAG
ncbi:MULTISPECIES: hypothetical protein [Bacteria]|uniref:hypothetical protein n=1 Tax=Bacteria TaxID=2 RepID=UPI003C7B95FF